MWPFGTSVEAMKKKGDVAGLAKALVTGPSDKRLAAAKALNGVLNDLGDAPAKPAGRTAQFCKTALHDPESWIRYAAARLLGKLKDASAADELAALLGDNDPSTRAAVAKSLQSIGNQRGNRVAGALLSMEKGKPQAVRDLLVLLAEECAAGCNYTPGIGNDLGAERLPSAECCLPVALHFGGQQSKAQSELAGLFKATKEARLQSLPVDPRCDVLLAIAMSHAFAGVSEQAKSLLDDVVRNSRQEDNAGARTGILLKAARVARRVQFEEQVDGILEKAHEAAMSASTTGMSFIGRSATQSPGQAGHGRMADGWAASLCQTVEKAGKEIRGLSPGIVPTFRDFATRLKMHEFVSDLGQGPIPAFRRLEGIADPYERLVAIILIEQTIPA